MKDPKVYCLKGGTVSLPLPTFQKINQQKILSIFFKYCILPEISTSEPVASSSKPTPSEIDVKDYRKLLFIPHSNFLGNLIFFNLTDNLYEKFLVGQEHC